MLSVPAAVVFAVIIWWASTGLILILDGLPRGTFRWSLVVSTLLAVAALFGLAHTANQTSVSSVYCAFTCALLVWGWHELSFLTGWITGPRRIASPPGLTGWPRFSQAVQAILWHELGILAAGAVIISITWDAPNQIGTWTFLVLWVMRTSAKLNLYFGVRNLSEEFLPPHLTYLQSFFRRRPMNAFFPFSVGIATVVLTLIFMSASDPSTTISQSVGLALVGTMLGLAILEHWLLVLPLSSTALWRWAIRHREVAKADTDTSLSRRSATTVLAADAALPILRPPAT
jgi:putative photosynthetic complex assembly protein 2